METLKKHSWNIFPALISTLTLISFLWIMITDTRTSINNVRTEMTTSLATFRAEISSDLNDTRNMITNHIQAPGHSWNTAILGELKDREKESVAAQKEYVRQITHNSKLLADQSEQLDRQSSILNQISAELTKIKERFK